MTRFSNWSRLSTLAILLTVLASVIIVSAGLGAYHIAPWRVPVVLLTGAEGQAVLTQVRFPRVLLGAIVGASLGVAGAALQGLFRNPLADPGLIGVSAGAGLGASLWIVLGAAVLPVPAVWGMTLAAFAGGAMVTWMAWKLANVQQLVSTLHLLLAGVAFNSLAGAGIGAMLFLSDDEQLRSITFWMLGGLGGATWPVVTTAAVFGLIGLILLLPLGRSLNLLALGEADAYHLGLDTLKINRRVILGGTLAVGAAVSAAGGISFVGLVIPHLLRLIFGPDHRLILPASAILGATLLVVSDLLARTAAAPIEIPVGVITAALGAPFFLLLVWQQRRVLSYA